MVGLIRRSLSSKFFLLHWMIRYSISENIALSNRPEAGYIQEKGKKKIRTLLINSFFYLQGAFIREILLEEFSKVWTRVLILQGCKQTS